jgi:hypothetical protein
MSTADYAALLRQQRMVLGLSLACGSVAGAAGWAGGCHQSTLQES